MALPTTELEAGTCLPYGGSPQQEFAVGMQTNWKPMKHKGSLFLRAVSAGSGEFDVLPDGFAPSPDSILDGHRALAGSPGSPPCPQDAFAPSRHHLSPAAARKKEAVTAAPPGAPTSSATRFSGATRGAPSVPAGGAQAEAAAALFPTGAATGRCAPLDRTDSSELLAPSGGPNATRASAGDGLRRPTSSTPASEQGKGVPRDAGGAAAPREAVVPMVAPAWAAGGLLVGSPLTAGGRSRHPARPLHVVPLPSRAAHKSDLSRTGSGGPGALAPRTLRPAGHSGPPGLIHVVGTVAPAQSKGAAGPSWACGRVLSEMVIISQAQLTGGDRGGAAAADSCWAAQRRSVLGTRYGSPTGPRHDLRKICSL